MSASQADKAPGPSAFRDLGLGEPLLQALAEVGYESPSPIQSATIPALLSGADLLGQAETGTGKTAAFALPALERLDLSGREPQVLVLVPTRELALQVAEAFQRYASHLKGFHVLPIYGGQSYQPQLNALRRGVHVVVGTPGRISDHLERGTLKLASIKLLVLDEADEMLRMGFLEAVEAILVKTPPNRQAALFSATLPAPIRRIAQKHLRSPVEVTIQSKTGTAANVRQRYWLVSGTHKLDALTRILETESFEGMLVFTRTKQATVELAEKLEARGFSAAPLNGDIPQAQRERTIARLKSGDVDIVVATDVAARGLDVDRVGHVVNYDAPYDPESYVHRVGRTGRAGRKGEAILFIAPRERNLLHGIERATRQRIEPMNLPTADAVNARRIAKFKARIVEAAALDASKRYRPILEQLEAETDLAAIDIAAALASLVQSSTPLLPASAAESPRQDLPHPSTRPASRPEAPRVDASRSAPRPVASRPASSPPGSEPRPRRDDAPRRAGRTETFRIEVGSVHEIKAGNIVGAIANEAGLDGAYIGRVDIREDHSFVELPEGMPREIFKTLKKTRLAGRELRITKVQRRDEGRPPAAARGTDDFRQREERVMSKGMDRKREEKKKPAKTLEEKRAAKKAKRESRG
ncbi:MAG TPA: DEAD/DEAH box helicase [Steroidobacteraceae bacterium]|jgi:ATP-dependent RNA helicase DeaD|nr:DEAD/DEAH box helicase [Steroidobacteraceae bacterium]